MTPEETYILLREIDELRERDSARLMDLQHAREEARADGAAAERAAIVAWLRLQGGRSAWTLVQEIEKCAHLWGVNRAG